MKCINCYQNIEEPAMHYKCAYCGKAVHKQCSIKKNDKPYCDMCFTAKKYKKQDIVIPDVIRRSYIETYVTCPYKFYMEVIKGYEQPENIFTKVGVDIHDLLDKATKEGNGHMKEDLIKEFTDIYDQYDEDLFESEEQLEKMYKRGVDSITNACEVLPYLPKPFSSEENIVFSIGKDMPKISCTSDRTHLNKDGELEVIDWKTGGVLVGKKHESDLQAPLYIYSVKQKYDKPVKRFTFYYLNENKVRVFERTDDPLVYACQVKKRIYYINLQDAIKEVTRIFSKIKQNQFNIPQNDKSMYFACRMCHLKHRNICEGAEIQAWKNKGEFDWNS